MEKNRFLKLLQFIWEKVPENRFGQMLASALNYTGLYYVSNEQLIQTLCEKYKIDLSDFEKKEKEKKPGKTDLSTELSETDIDLEKTKKAFKATVAEDKPKKQTKKYKL